jgi:Zn-dependent peptidase ImmA (M78 family)
MVNYFGRPSLEKTLIQMIRDLIATERVKLISEHRTTYQEVADFYGLSLEKIYSQPNQDGMLVEDRIILNLDGKGQERTNFTFYHEITHHLIRANEDVLTLIHEILGDIDKMIERLCNVGAACFLVPPDELNAFLTDNGFSVTAIPLLCEKYMASGLVVAFQMINHARHDCYLVVATPTEKMSEILPLMSVSEIAIEPQIVLSVLYSAASSQAKYSIARETVIPPDHLIYNAYREGIHIKGHSFIPFRSGNKKPAECDAIFFRNNVYAFLNVTMPISSQQLTLL